LPKDFRTPETPRLESRIEDSKSEIGALTSEFEIRDSGWQVSRPADRIPAKTNYPNPVHSSKRLFVGIGVPASCKTELVSLDPHLNGLRWLAAEQLHLTLSFLGDVEAAAEDRLHEALRQVRLPPFFLPLCGVGVFNVRGRPSVIWAGVGKGHPHLFALHRRIQDAVLHAGLEPDLKPFHPHVTIGRAKGISRQALQPFLRKHAEANFGMFEVTGFELYSSVLAAEGAIHQVEMRQEF
jgi:RNA 2',3'-cyclic 3'-phosphodiesterase